MSDTALELRVAAMQSELRDLRERVRITATAERFIAGDHEIRDGDFVKFVYIHHAARVSISSDGKWTYMNSHGQLTEPFRVPSGQEIERLYTIAEVAEIVEQSRGR